MSNEEYDVIIIGSGPGGYVGAIRASQLGLKTCVIEKDKPGGVCLNMGCIPSKALLHQAELFRSLDDLKSLGVSSDTSGFDYGKVYKKSRKAATQLSKGVNFLLKKNNVPLIEGEAVITGKNEVTVKKSSGEGEEKFKGKNIIIATGSKPKVIPGFEFDGERVLSSDHALLLEELPKSLVILGGGAIGCEFAHIMNAFGVEVTIVEMLDHLLPLEDAEAVKVLETSFKRRKIKMFTKTKASGLKKGKNSVTVSLEKEDGSKEDVEAEKVLAVFGRAPNSEGLGLETVGVTVEKGFIQIGDYYRTNVPSIFAVGDVVATPLLAHVASKECEVAIEYIAGENPEPRIPPETIPSAVYTEPQIASFGITEEKAKEQELSYKSATFPYRGAGKTVAVEQPDGIVKIIYEPEMKELLGCHIAGADATELIHELLLAKTAELLPEDIAKMIHAHPTISEAVMEGMRAVDGWAIHA
jgi:dihydrolipoamide dehydrogenase